MYAITPKFLSGIPKLPFRNGVGAYEGIVLHSTGNGEDTALGNVNYEQDHWQDAFVHYFIDETGIYQTASTDFRAWGAGANANPRFVHIELCETKNHDDFLVSYNQYVWLAGYLLYSKKLGVTPAKADGTGTLWSHADVTKILGGTTHPDPIDFLASHGKTWANVVNDVTYVYNQYVEQDKPKFVHYITGGFQIGSDAQKAFEDYMNSKKWWYTKEEA
jgi:N-acetylmuramoyl-L-alanine amidase CwlA